MKNKRNKKTKKAAQKPESHNTAAAKLVDMDRWWAELSPEDKQFVYEIGLMTGVAKKRSAKWPQNSPQRRGLN